MTPTATSRKSRSGSRRSDSDNPSLFTARTLADEIHRANAAPACGAITNAAVGDPEGSLSIEGWSWMPPGIRRPDQVFLVTDEAAPRVLGFSGPAGHSADAVDYRNRTGRKAGGWNIFIKKASLLSGTTVLHAYVLDANQRTAFRVGGALGLTVEQDRTPRVGPAPLGPDELRLKRRGRGVPRCPEGAPKIPRLVSRAPRSPA